MQNKIRVGKMKAKQVKVMSRKDSKIGKEKNLPTPSQQTTMNVIIPSFSFLVVD